jgi:hypothetical protein
MIEAMKQALEALEGCTTWHLTREQYDRNVTTIVALRAAIAETSMQRLTDVQQEMEQKPAIYPEEARELGLEEIPYYTHPPRREWAGLTDGEKENLYKQADAGNWDDEPLLNAVEAKLKEKNS